MTNRFATQITSYLMTAVAIMGPAPSVSFASTPPSPSFGHPPNPNPGVVPINSKPYGLSYGDWTAVWWQWVLSVPASKSPIGDTTGADCAQHQFGPVWFLAGTGGGIVTRNCTIPVGTAVLFPILNYLNDYPCPVGPNAPPFEPDPGQSLEDFLTNGNANYPGARDVEDNPQELVATVDNVPLRNLAGYRATSRLFYFKADSSYVGGGDPCINGRLQPAVSDGYWIMLTPLPPGTHTIQFTGIGSDGFTAGVKYNLKVVGH
jgi:hypothetical protein